MNPDLEVGSLVERDALADDGIEVLRNMGYGVEADAIEAKLSWLTEHDRQRDAATIDVLAAEQSSIRALGIQDSYDEGYLDGFDSALKMVRAVQGGEPQADQGIHIRQEAGADATGEGWASPNPGMTPELRAAQSDAIKELFTGGWKPGTPCASCGSTNTTLHRDGLLVVGHCNGCGRSDDDD